MERYEMEEIRANFYSIPVDFGDGTKDPMVLGREISKALSWQRGNSDVHGHCVRIVGMPVCKLAFEMTKQLYATGQPIPSGCTTEEAELEHSRDHAKPEIRLGRKAAPGTLFVQILKHRFANEQQMSEIIDEMRKEKQLRKMRKDKRDIASTFVTPLSPFGEMEKKNTKHLQVEAAEAAERGAAFFKFGLKAQMKWKVMYQILNHILFIINQKP